MNTSRSYRLALVISAIAACLHIYVTLIKSTQPSLGWFLWMMLPYAFCLGVWFRSNLGIPALAGVLPVLAFDSYTYYSVFVNPTSSTASLAMNFIPLWSTLLVCPIVMLFAWLGLRQDKSAKQKPQ